ncbi:MAG: ribonuclease III [Gammaproteobacteria bacterium]
MTRSSREKLTLFMQQLGYVFRDLTLLEAALSHRSTGNRNNERLEFLGDGILNFTMAAELFQRYPEATEGELTRLRANFVKGETLAALASELNFSDYLRLGSGELRSGGVRRKSILADAFEAVVGAIYLDADLATCQQLISRWFAPRLAALATIPKDAKTHLQEYLQSKKLPLPEYKIVNLKGEVHAQIFYVECRVPSLSQVTKGTGSSRRLAEQQAAQKMLTLVQQLV